MRGCGHTRRGVTLPEMMTAIIVLGIVVGSVVSVYQVSLRTWRRGTMENYAQQKASWVIQRLVPEIRLGMSVTPGGAPMQSSYIAIRLPSRTFDSATGTYYNDLAVQAGQLYLVPGRYALYYRGTADGALSATGSYLWRRLMAADGTTVIQADRLADNIVDNPPDASGLPKPMFIYYPDMYHLKSVEVTISVEEHIGGRKVKSTMNSEIALRNK